MGDEIEILREEIRRIHEDNKESNKEIKETLDTLGGAITDIRVLVAEDYIKRDEFEDNRKELWNKIDKVENDYKIEIKDVRDDIQNIRSERYKIAGIVGTIAAVGTSVVFGIINALN